MAVALFFSDPGIARSDVPADLLQFSLELKAVMPVVHVSDNKNIDSSVFCDDEVFCFGYDSDLLISQFISEHPELHSKLKLIPEACYSSAGATINAIALYCMTSSSNIRTIPMHVIQSSYAH